MKIGWFSLDRKIFRHWLAPNGKRAYTHLEAWLYLLSCASYKDSKAMLGDYIVNVKRGQTLTSIRRLGEEFKWSKGKVSRFLNELENDEMLIQKRTTHYTVLTIVNYEFYQEQNKKQDHQQTTDGPQTGTFNKGNKYNNKKDTTDTDVFLQEYKDVDEYE